METSAGIESFIDCSKQYKDVIPNQGRGAGEGQVTDNQHGLERVEKTRNKIRNQVNQYITAWSRLA